MTPELPYDVLTGIPEPTRRRWQPLRAGITNLFRYDDQTFAFHNGRLLLRGNNGSGKSMAVEVLIPYVLDADLSPQRLSTFGGRERGMFLWLLGHEKPAVRPNARAYVWVEFGRQHPDSGCEYFTAGAGLEGLRSDTSVKAFYWTTAARIGVHLTLGRPGTEPLTKPAMADLLAEQTAAGRPGQVHPDPKTHRRAVNDTLYGLQDRRFDALRATLLQLRRPKLSDKLNEESLNLILRNSLPPIAEATVRDLAEGFERLDRHAAAVGELRETIAHLESLQTSYRRYARVAGTARADAVAAAETAIDTAREKVAAAQATIEHAGGALKRVAERRRAIDDRLSEITGRHKGLTNLEAYREGQAAEPLRELVDHLKASASGATQTARQLRGTAERDTYASELATRAAIDARDAAADERLSAEAAALAAAVTDTHTALAAAVDELRSRDVADEKSLHDFVTRARALVSTMVELTTSWDHTIDGLRRLAQTARSDEGRLRAAREETGRAEGEVIDAEGLVNTCLGEDHTQTLAWVDALTTWAQASPQLSAGQAAPLPWDPATVLERAPRWAREAHDARTSQLHTDRIALLSTAGAHDSTARAWETVVHRMRSLAELLSAAASAAAAHSAALTAHRDAVLTWAGQLRELPHGAPLPDWTGAPATGLAAAVAAWAERAAAARSQSLVAQQTTLNAYLEQATARVAELEANEQRLSVPGLPDVPAPPTRQAERTGRAGAPFYLLVDFADTLSVTDRAGLEAAAIDSGVADAWVSPDGQLLSGADGTPLLDTQLSFSEPDETTPAERPFGRLADALVPDPSCADAGVPADVVAALLERIALGDIATADPAAADNHTDTGPDRHDTERGAGNLTALLLGRDGSWRAGTLTGAHTVPAVTLIGAANREADRLAKLAQVRDDLERARGQAANLKTRRDNVTAALRVVKHERAIVPDDEDVRTASDTAQGAAADVRAAVAAAHAVVSHAGSRLPEAHLPPARRGSARPGGSVDDGDDGGDVEQRAEQASTTARIQWAATSSATTHDPTDSQHAQALTLLVDLAATAATTWRDAAARLRQDADGIAHALAATRVELEAMPDPQPVRDARDALEAARRDLVSAQSRLAGRRGEEMTAHERVVGSAAVLRVALLSSGLPEDSDPAALADALRRYREQARAWLGTEAEVICSTGAVTLAASRATQSTQRADSAEQSAAEQGRAYQEQNATLQALTDTYGVEYTNIVAELETLDQERTTLGKHQQQLGATELEQVGRRSTAEAERKAAEEHRQAAEEARTAAGSAFLAAARLGVLTTAHLPDAPPAGSDGGARAALDEALPGTDTSPTHDVLGVRALRSWARAVRDVAGDRLTRDVVAVEQAANRVTDTRYSLEPSLAGRITVRDEHREQLLLLHASRAGHTAPLGEMIATLGEELLRDDALLAHHEAELFRKFLAEETRREVTTKVRDARTTIKAMTDLMGAHPTSSGIRVRLRWVPDEKNAPGMQDIVTLMGKDAPLDSEKDRLQAFFRQRIERVRASADADWNTQLAELLDYRQWWRFQLAYRHGGDDGWTALNSKTHGALSGGEKAVCLHLPLFAAAATYCDSASVRALGPDGTHEPGCPRLIVLDEVFTGVDEDNRGALFDIVRTLDLDLVATSESEQGLYPQLDGMAIYHLVTSDALDCVLAARSVWDGHTEHRMLDTDLAAIL